MMVHTYDASTGEDMLGEVQNQDQSEPHQVQVQPRLHSETQSTK